MLPLVTAKVSRGSVRLLLFLLVGASGAFVSAEGPWARKPYFEWTEDEVLKLLTDSPWAKTWHTLVDTGRGGDTRPSDAPSESAATSGQHQTCCRTLGSGAGAAPADPTSAGGGGGTTSGGVISGGTSQVRYYRVLWLSSMRLRQALWRLRQLNGEPRDPGAEAALVQPLSQIVIALSGPSMQRFHDATLAALKDSTFLSSKKNRTKQLELSSFVSPAERRDRMALFVFRRDHDGKPAFDESDDEVEFSTGAGGQRIRVSFKLDKMMTSGALDF